MNGMIYRNSREKYVVIVTEPVIDYRRIAESTIPMRKNCMCSKDRSSVRHHAKTAHGNCKDETNSCRVITRRKIVDDSRVERGEFGSM